MAESESQRERFSLRKVANALGLQGLNNHQALPGDIKLDDEEECPAGKTARELRVIGTVVGIYWHCQRPFSSMQLSQRGSLGSVCSAFC